MEDPEYITKKLKLRTNASSVVRYPIDGERLQYELIFTEDIGMNWLVSELGKAFAELAIGMQKWEIKPALDSGEFRVTVRETDRRPDLESDQNTLNSFK